MLMTNEPRKYVRIYGGVKNDIMTGVLSIGKPCPTIGELCRQFGNCDRKTAAKALEMLEDDGLLRRYPGHGYIVIGDGRD